MEIGEVNDEKTRRKIEKLIESCRRPRGGLTRRFFQHVGVFVPRRFKIPPGWKRDLMENGSASDILEGVARYHEEQP